MRRILLDEGVPVGLRRYIQGFIVETAAEAGWAGLTNGDLIAAAEQAGFEIMVTCDQNIRYQQNLSGRLIALVVLETNHWQEIRPTADAVAAMIIAAQPGSFASISFDRPALRRRPYPPMPKP
jgi:hypothetical protein